MFPGDEAQQGAEFAPAARSAYFDTNYAAYPSPEGLQEQALYSGFYAQSALYEPADGFGDERTGLATPLSLYESPLFDETPWLVPNAPLGGDLGVIRQHALEKDLGFDQFQRDDIDSAPMWGDETVQTQPTLSYSPTTISPPTVASSPLSSLGSPQHESPPPPNEHVVSSQIAQPATSPLIPPPDSSAAFLTLTSKALENRLLRDELPSPSTSSAGDGRRPRPTSYPSASRSPARLTKEGLECSCSSCGAAVAQLNFRGKGDCLNVPLFAEYWCLRCAPPPGGPGGGATDDDPPVRYEDTLSGVLDRMQGVATSRSEPELIRWRPRADREEGVLVCDVCKLLVGTGSLCARDPDDEVEFGIEVVCSACSYTYARCSDCGGGGGPRLGVGKWRCRELFGGGRKTCQLSHLRLGSLEEMTYDCWRISDLPAAELEELVSACKELHYSTLLQTLATPDSLEGPGAIAKTYDQVSKLAADGWTLIEPLIRQDAPPSTLKQRYIALRFSTPIPRKKAKVSRANAKRERTTSTNSTTSLDSSSGGVLRPGKNIVGFIIGELNLSNGTLYLPIIMPSGSVGDTYEATTTLLQHLSSRVYADLDSENTSRAARRTALLPPLREVWTMTLFTKDPRGVNHLETRRGFSSLEKYGLAHPYSDLGRFSALKSGILPPELTAGWQVFVRDLRVNDDWSAKLTASAKRKTSASTTAYADGLNGKKVKR